MKICKEDLLVKIFKSIEGIFDILCPSKDTADFLNCKANWNPDLDQSCKTHYENRILHNWGCLKTVTHLGCSGLVFNKKTPGKKAKGTKA